MEAYKNQFMDAVEQEHSSSVTSANEPVSFDFDILLDTISKTEDLDVLGNIYDKTLSELQHQTELLKNIRKQNANMKYTLNSSKFSSSELDQFHTEEQQRADSLREMIEAKRVELERLHQEHVDNLVQFESDVHKISETFTEAPKEYEQTSVMNTVLKLQKDLEEKKNEFIQYKHEIRAAETKFKQGQADDGFTRMSLKVFEESIHDINTLNEKLTQSVEQMTGKMNTLRFQMSTLNLHN